MRQIHANVGTLTLFMHYRAFEEQCVGYISDSNYKLHKQRLIGGHSQANTVLIEPIEHN